MVDNPYEPPREPVTSSSDAPRLRAIELRGSLQLSDVMHTQGLLLRRRWPHLLLCVALYVGLVLALSLFQVTGAWWQNSFLLVGLVLGPCLLPLTLGFALVRLYFDSARQQGLFAPTTSRLTEQGIESGDHMRPWEAFDRFAQSDRVVLLFLRGSQDHLIVARSKLVAAEDWHPLLGFLEKQLARL